MTPSKLPMLARATQRPGLAKEEPMNTETFF